MSRRLPAPARETEGNERIKFTVNGSPEEARSLRHVAHCGETQRVESCRRAELSGRGKTSTNGTDNIFNK